MRDLDPEQLFERYRSAGDTAALAALFDRTAPELLKLARMLVRDRSLAEDLLQATFVTAIEKAQAFDGSRRIEPWLLGILAKHAATARRKNNRFIDAERLVFEPVDDPHDEVERREFADEVERALADLPAVYREVLEPRLRDDRRGEDIARDLGRSPGVVRMQISRGLALLKRVLPHGFSTALLVSLWNRRALATVRDAVLEHAAASAPTATAVAAAKTAAVTLVGGIVVSKLPVITAALALLAASAWFVLRDDEGLPADLPAIAQAKPETVETDARSVPIESTRAPIATADAAATNAVVDAALQTRWPRVAEKDFAQIEGRIVEADGRPVAGFDVTLLELDFNGWQGAIDTLFNADAMTSRLEVARATTNEDGRFRLNGADAGAAHALGLDLGGPRSTARVVDLALAAGERADLGDIELPGGIALSGRVVDEDGEAVAGARVRLVPLPLPIGTFGVQHFRSNDELARAARPTVGPMVFEPPAWVRHAWDALPIPTVTTQADGTFAFPSVQAGTISLVADDPRFVAAVKGPFATGTARAHDVGSIELARGRTLTGRVVDSNGHGIANADVIAGVVPEIGGIIAVKHAPPTGADGSFSSPPLSEDGEVFVAARRRPRDCWTTVPTADMESVTIELATGIDLELIVLDQRGNATAQPEVHVRPSQPVPVEAPLVGAVADARVKVEPAGPGHHLVRDLLPGQYLVAVRVEGFATAFVTVDVAADVKPVEVRLQDERRLEVAVVAAGTGSPVRGARVTASSQTAAAKQSGALTRQTTDANGIASLRGLPIGEQIVLTIDRPAYAHLEVVVPTDATKHAVTLTTGGQIEGTVLVSGSAPAEPLMVCFLKNRHLSSATPKVPRVALTDGRGGFALRNVSDGEYSIEIYPRVFAAEPAAMLQGFDGDITPLYRGSIKVKSGEVARFDVDLVMPNSAGAASLYGRLRIDGEPVSAASFSVVAGSKVSGATISVDHAQGHGWKEPDANGDFSFDPIAPGDVDLQIYLTTEFEDGGKHYEQIYHRRYVVASGQTERVNLDLVSTIVRVHVRSADGSPAANAGVSLSGLGGATAGLSRFGHTNADGDVELRVFANGKYAASAEHDTLGVASDEIEVPNALVTMTLDPGAPCAGTFKLGLGILVDANTSCHVDFIPATQSKDVRYRSVMLSGPDVRTFAVAGLNPGDYFVHFRNGETTSAALPLTLTAAGATNLEFVFEAKP